MHKNSPKHSTMFLISSESKNRLALSLRFFFLSFVAHQRLHRHFVIWCETKYKKKSVSNVFFLILFLQADRLSHTAIRKLGIRKRNLSTNGFWRSQLLRIWNVVYWWICIVFNVSKELMIWYGYGSEADCMEICWYRKNVRFLIRMCTQRITCTFFSGPVTVLLL